MFGSHLSYGDSTVEIVGTRQFKPYLSTILTSTRHINSICSPAKVFEKLVCEVSTYRDYKVSLHRPNSFDDQSFVVVSNMCR